MWSDLGFFLLIAVGRQISSSGYLGWNVDILFKYDVTSTSIYKQDQNFHSGLCGGRIGTIPHYEPKRILIGVDRVILIGKSNLHSRNRIFLVNNVCYMC